MIANRSLQPNGRLHAGIAEAYLRTPLRNSPNVISVCHIASGDAWGGAEAQIATLLKTLACRDDVRPCAIVLNDSRLAHELLAAGVETRIIPESRMSFPRVVAEAASYLRDRGVQVLHSHRYKENLLATLLSVRFHVRLVKTQHGKPEPAGAKQKLVYAMDRFLARHAADRVVSVSDDLTAYLQTHVPTRKLSVIRNGIELESIRSELSKAQAKHRLSIGPDLPVVGIATRLTPIKRLDLFVATAAEISKRLPGAHFLIAGGGAQEGLVRSWIQKAGMECTISMLGHREDIRDVMRAMDVILFTSDHEGLPMALLEAMALGVPVISRRVGGIPEVIQDGVNGVLIDSAEPEQLALATIALLQEEFNRARIASNALHTVQQQYSAEKNADHVVSLYRSLAASIPR